ncbi:MAG: hypothetical protein NG737_05995 [Omnitrophica bacterium]|nr:hypothetical protein [Candidatus Omnitrophota bacterium]
MKRIINCISLSACLVLLLIGCYSSQSESSQARNNSANIKPEAIWENFLLVLQSGNPEKVRAVSTEEGFKLLLRLQASFEDKSEMLKRLGRSWSQDKIRWINISEKKLIGTKGPPVKPSGIYFIKDGKAWKFDRFSPGR